MQYMQMSLRVIQVKWAWVNAGGFGGIAKWAGGMVGEIAKWVGGVPS